MLEDTLLPAQTHTVNPDPHFDQQFYSKAIQEAKNKNLRVPIDVQLHIIRKSDGSDGFTLNESNDLMRSINWAFANTLLIFQALHPMFNIIYSDLALFT